MLNVDYYFRGEYKISTIFKPEKTWDANMAYDLSVSNVEFDSIEVKPVESNSKTTGMFIKFIIIKKRIQ